MPPKPTPSPNIAVTFGSVARLFPVQKLHDALRPCGLSLEGTLALLRMLKVPVLHTPKAKLIDSNSLYLALKAVLRVGEPDFVAPEAEPPQDHPWTSSLDLERFRRDYTKLQCDVLYSYASNAPALSRDVDALMGAAREATLRLALAYLPALHKIQEKYDDTALEHAVKSMGEAVVHGGIDP